MTIAIPQPWTWANGDAPNFREMNARTSEMVNFLLNPPFIRLRKVTVQSIPTSTSTNVSWDYLEVESDEMWSSADPTKIKPSTPGWYVGNAGYSFNANSTGYREMNVIKNADASNPIIRVKNDAYPSGSVVSRGNLFITNFNGTTDYIQMSVWQNVGSSQDIVTTAIEHQPDFSLLWIAPL